MADIAGNSSTTATLSLGGTLSSGIDFVGDHDWIKVYLTAGQAVDIKVGLGTLEDSYLNIYAPDGTTIVASDDDIVDGVQRGSEVKFNPASTGWYYIDVSAWADPNQGQPGDTYTGVGTYTVSVQSYTPPPVWTNDKIANQLTSGYWGGDVHHWAVTQGGTLTVDIHTLTATEQNIARTALSEWSDIIGVHFQEVTSGAKIVFSDAKDTDGSAVAQTDAAWSNGIITSSNIQISSNWVSNWSSLNSYGLQTYIHEIGHALGLGHAGNYNGDATYPYDASFANDAWSTSIMSYFSPSENSYFANQGFSDVYALTPMVDDIIAMQTLYGLSTTTRTGDTVYGDHSTAGGVYNAVSYPNVAFTIFDSGGNDTIDYSLSSFSQLINLNPETFSNVDGYTGNLEIARGVVIENAIGGSRSDTLVGNSANNTLTGNAGADTLTGGAGNDMFKDTLAGHSGDTITDFNVGDTIVFSDAALATFSFSLSGQTLFYTGGTMTLNGVTNGTFTATTAATGGVQLAETILRHPHNDFNGDGRSDVLWRSDAGTVTDWLGQFDGSFAANSSNLSVTVPSDWRIAGTGDFNGDGRSDILWRSDAGTVRDWLGQSNGGFAGNTANLDTTVPSDWHIAGTGDFNGDGRSDILWRNDAGTVRDWLGQATGGFAGNTANLNAAIGTDWHVVGTGDFNGDGRTDVLWRSDAGTVTDWLGQFDGGFATNSSNLSVTVPSDWHIAGTGDFNGDGRSDILWRSDAGTVRDWLGQPNGGFTGNTANLDAALGTDWHIVGIGDFNSGAPDGVDDLLLQRNDGTLIDWIGQSNGSFAAGSLNTHPATGWHVMDPFVHDPFGSV